MALTNTTLSTAVATTDNQIIVASATGFAVGYIVQINQESFIVAQNYVSGTTIPVLRGKAGTLRQAHVSSSIVTVGTGDDFLANSPQLSGAIAIAGRARTLTSYVASGAIALPAPGNDAVAILLGTSALTMTIAAPTQDLNGSILTVIGAAKSQSTVATATTVGFGNAGASYDTFTLQNAGNVALQFMACNGFWVILNTPITGTSTAFSAGIA